MCIREKHLFHNNISPHLKFIFFMKGLNIVNKGCDGEENFPPVNRPDVTLVITVSPGGGGGGGV